MRRKHWFSRIGSLALAGLLGLGCPGMALASDAGSAAGTQDLPFEMVLDLNTRQQPVYDGFSQYVDAFRVSEEDTFHISVDSSDVDLTQASMDYLVITYDEEGTQISQECTVYGLETGTNYPVYQGKKRRELFTILWTAVTPFVSITGKDRKAFIFRCFLKRRLPNIRI